MLFNISKTRFYYLINGFGKQHLGRYNTVPSRKREERNIEAYPYTIFALRGFDQYFRNIAIIT